TASSRRSRSARTTVPAPEGAHGDRGFSRAPKPLERLAGGRRPGQPCAAFVVELLDLRSAQPRQACLDAESCLRLQVREVPVTVGGASEKHGVELEPGD